MVGMVAEVRRETSGARCRPFFKLAVCYFVEFVSEAFFGFKNASI